MIDPDAVEEADIELCASGFDNLLMDVEQEELRSYHTMLVEMKALKCATVVKELLDWIDANKEEDALDVVDANEERCNDLWERYNAASVEEDPRKIAESIG